MLKKSEISEICRKIKNCSIGVIGDFCIDIYWSADMTRSELSRETPHYPLPVTEEKIYLGAGGNVAANIAALKPKNLYAETLIGGDWRGSLLQEAAEKLYISGDYFISVPERFTPAYCKPMLHGISDTVYENPRIDFDNFSLVCTETENKIIKHLKEMSKKIDILCVADQFRYGIITPKVRQEIIKLAKNGLSVTVDSRCSIACYTNCILKPNEVECLRAAYDDGDRKNAEEKNIAEAAKRLAKRNDAQVFCTLGEKGSLVTDGETTRHIQAVKLSGELDTCGAGDASLSAFACAFACGEKIEKAAEFAGMASAVAIKKIGMTGSATAEEIERLAK